MKKIKTPLFSHITDSEWKELECSGCIRCRHFPKNTAIFHMGDLIQEIGIVLTGSVNIETIDFWGNKSLLSNISPGEIFAESYALCKEPIMVSAVAAEGSEILLINFMQVTKYSETGCSWASRLMQNMLQISLHKNLLLSSRIFCTTPKTIRERLLIYLSKESAKAKSTTFRIPFNRQQLADYLNLDRSALSKELGKMRNERILDFRKNQFTLFHTPLPGLSEGSVLPSNRSGQV